jgi:hypothetical protein
VIPQRQRKVDELGLSLILFLFILGWVCWHWRIYFHPQLLLPEDNFKTHFNLFSYIYGFLRHFRSFPDWVYTQQGGMSLAPLSNNYLTLMPQRWLGYFFALTTEIPVVLVYKFCTLILGQGIFLLGVFLCASSLLRGKYYGIAAVFLCVVSSPSISLLHQEQTLGTTLFVPYIWWALYQSRTDRRWLCLAGALMGWALNIHYPHLQVLYWGSALILFLLFERKTLRETFEKGRTQTLLAFFLLFLSSLPVVYSYFTYKDQLVSPFRNQGDSLSAETFESYLHLNRQQESSVHPGNLLLYLNPFLKTENMAPLDRYTFFVTPLVILSILFAIFLAVKRKPFQLLFLTLLVTLSIGVNGPWPRILFPFFPGIGMFRQWYHFIPLFNLHLIFLALMGLKQIREEKSRSLASVLLMIGIFSGSLWGNSAWNDYEKYFARIESNITEADNLSRFVYRAIWEQNPLYEPILVKFKGTPEGKGFFVQDRAGFRAELPLSSFVIQPRARGFFLDMRPLGAELTLHIPQYNDGNWLLSTLSGTQKIESDGQGWLSFRLGAERRIEVFRRRALWRYLILLPWLTAFFSLFYLSGFKRRSA